MAAAIGLSSREGLEAEEIEEVEIHTFTEAASIAGMEASRSVEEARFSLRYVVAASLTYRRLGLRELEEGLGDPRVLRLLKNTRVVVDKEFDRIFPSRQPSLVRVKAFGRRLESLVDAPPGDPDNPVGLEAILEKARSITDSAYALANKVLKDMKEAGPVSIHSP